MNEYVRSSLSSRAATTQAAEGLPRRRWCLDDILAMQKAGIVGYDERFELIGGEIVPMSPKGIRHEVLKAALNIHWARALPPELNLLSDTTLYISADEFREPDFIFWPASIGLADLKPADILLLVEIADSSLGYDLGAKAKTYAAFGVEDYWVINARSLVTHIYREPSASGYEQVNEHPGSALLTPLRPPDLAVRLIDLGLSPAEQ